MRKLRLLFCCLAAAFSATAPLRADAPRPNAQRAAYRDLQLAVHIRQALRDDQELALLNVGVHVKDGIARLWGPIPSADQLTRAINRASSIQGVFEVKSELYIAKLDAKPDALLLTFEEEKQRSASASPDFVTGLFNSLTGRTVAAAAALSADRDAAPRTAGGIDLLAPIFGNGPPPAASAPRPTQAATPHLSQPEELSAAVERVRRSEPRFTRLKAVVNGDIVTIAGPADQGEAVMDLASKVSLLPGVRRVVTKTKAGDTP